MGMPTNFLVNYYRADGTDQSWPSGAANALPYSDYATKMQAMEPRFKADNYAHCINCWNNPGDNAWAYANCGQGQNHNGSGSGDAFDVSLGGVKAIGGRSLPLIQISVTPVFAIDLNATLSLTASSTQFRQSGLSGSAQTGFTFTF